MLQRNGSTDGIFFHGDASRFDILTYLVGLKFARAIAGGYELTEEGRKRMRDLSERRNRSRDQIDTGRGYLVYDKRNPLKEGDEALLGALSIVDHLRGDLTNGDFTADTVSSKLRREMSILFGY